MKLPPLNPQLQTALRRLAAVLGLLALFLLAAGLPGLKLKPGIRYILPEGEPAQPGEALPPADITSWFDAFLIVSVVLFVISLAIILRGKDTRRKTWRILRQILLYGLMFALIFSIYNSRQQDSSKPLPEATGSPAPVWAENSKLGQQTAVPGEVSTEPLPSWGSYLLSLAIVLAIGLAGYWVWRMTRPPQGDLAEIARQAMDDLNSGRDWEDVVIRCYAEMSAAAQSHRGMHRPEAMTPREFAERLEAAGLPAQSIQTLTRLFEKARYGSRRSSTDESQTAMACLTEILAAVENPA